MSILQEAGNNFFFSQFFPQKYVSGNAESKALKLSII
ncbi:hypothetical protein SLEP1_g38980 [Rubroshorea leprosula]|uniref:Ribosomal protein L32 n=1 Tax=Rubroshorea leprosula TaxID=152421 RepID=A0AAV5KZ14_9ROSI|nr:hypothetical protein SLEP1_g38980 [Rubroshorea leprosula]